MPPHKRKKEREKERKKRKEEKRKNQSVMTDCTSHTYLLVEI